MGCKKEAELKKRFEPAAKSAMALQWLSCFASAPMAESVRDYLSSRGNVGFLQILPDGSLLFDYSDGIFCADGIVRKGKCKIMPIYSSNGLNDTSIMSATTNDSFAIQTQSGWVYFTGNVKSIATGFYTFMVEGDGTFRLSDQEFQVEGHLDIEQDPKGITGRSALFTHRLQGKIITQDGLATFEKCIKNKGCSPFYATGTGEFVANSEGDEVSQILFDAYGNAGCDQVIKIVQQRGEILFNTW